MRRGEIIYGICERVIDGDTFVLITQTLKWDIRIYGIDAPEHNQPFWRESTRYLRALIDKKRVECLIVNKDRYSRIICRVRLLDGTDIANEMLLTGMAWYYCPRAAEVDYYTISKAARAKKIGVYVDPNAEHPHIFREKKLVKNSRSK